MVSYESIRSVEFGREQEKRVVHPCVCVQCLKSRTMYTHASVQCTRASLSLSFVNILLPPTPPLPSCLQYMYCLMCLIFPSLPLLLYYVLCMHAVAWCKVQRPHHFLVSDIASLSLLLLLLCSLYVWVVESKLWGIVVTETLCWPHYERCLRDDWWSPSLSTPSTLSTHSSHSVCLSDQWTPISKPARQPTDRRTNDDELERDWPWTQT